MLINKASQYPWERKCYPHFAEVETEAHSLITLFSNEASSCGCPTLDTGPDLQVLRTQ